VSDERRFTLAEANAELEDLRRHLPVLRQARRGLIETTAKVTDAVAVDGGGTEGSDWFRHQQALKAEVEHLAARGILLRDPEVGLVDFPAEREGRGVFLCWRLDEPEVAYFHEEDSGFSGRMPW